MAVFHYFLKGKSVLSASLLWIACTGISSAGAAAQDDIKVAIISAWKKRQEEIKTLRVSWTQTRRIARGSLPRPAHGEIPQPPPNAIIPPIDVTLTGDYELVLDGDSIRFDEKGQAFSTTRNSAYNRNVTMVFHAGVHKHWCGDDVASHPVGEVEARAPPGLTSNRDLRAIKLIFFPFGSRHFRGYSEDQLVVDSNSLIYDGVKCLVLRTKSRDSAAHFWIDATRDYLPLRYTLTAENSISADVAIKYRRGNDGVWLVSGWTVKSGSAGKPLTEDFSASIKEIEVNRTIDEGAFSFEFPVGTWVYDKVNKAEFVIADGDIVHVKEGDSNRDYERLMASGKSWLSPITATAAIVAVLLILYVIGRRALALKS